MKDYWQYSNTLEVVSSLNNIGKSLWSRNDLEAYQYWLAIALMVQDEQENIPCQQDESKDECPLHICTLCRRFELLLQNRFRKKQNLSSQASSSCSDCKLVGVSYNLLLESMRGQCLANARPGLFNQTYATAKLHLLYQCSGKQSPQHWILKPSVNVVKGQQRAQSLIPLTAQAPNSTSCRSPSEMHMKAHMHCHLPCCFPSLQLQVWAVA